jgi:sugar phosphate isomerase/epimerase
MVAYGFERVSLAADLHIASALGASCVEVLPLWNSRPDPSLAARQIQDAGLALWSAHGSWGGQSVFSHRVDLAATSPADRQASLDDLYACIDWLAQAGGSLLVVHPGAASDPLDHHERQTALADSLASLADRAAAAQLLIALENMPHGVHPGSHMSDLARIVAQIDHPALGLALDTGHAALVDSPDHAAAAAQNRLWTTHVHDNDGRADLHWPPGLGIINWTSLALALDHIDYQGPIILECIRELRNRPETIPHAARIAQSLCRTPPHLDHPD